MRLRTSEVLNKAADEIQRRGWKQGDGWDPRGDGLCLEGGIIAAMGQTAGDFGNPPIGWNQCPAYKAVNNYLVEAGELPEGAWTFIWNDQYGRTAEEVIEVLRSAALIEEARENQSIKIKEEVSA